MTAVREQLPMTFASRSIDPGPRWFGLRMDHRSLFDGLQAEWLLPIEGRNGHILRPESFHADTRARGGVKHLIEVGLRVDLAHTPVIEVLAHRGGDWVRTTSNDIPHGTTAIFWPGPLSLSDGLDLQVENEEQRIRLETIAAQVSNIPLSRIGTGMMVGGEIEVAEPHVVDLCGLSFPDDYDRRRGAAAMAWWALPRTDPWFDLMVASLTNAEQIMERARYLDAPWLVNLPWMRGSQAEDTFDSCLWEAALRTLSVRSGRGSRALVEVLAEAALDFGAPPSAVKDWVQETSAILRAEAVVDVETTRRSPVGGALQLLLTRTAPDDFKTWATDRKQIPPAVWWSGAVLCGLFCGYEELPVMFRGDGRRRKYLALEMLEDERVATGALRWERHAGTTRFVAGGSVIAEMVTTARGAWYRSKFDDPSVRDAAIREVRRLRWPCLRKRLTLEGGVLTYSGSGSMSLQGSSMIIDGVVEVDLPGGATIAETVDVDGFRRCLATRGGDLMEPPKPGRSSDISRIGQQIVVSSISDVPGLDYAASFLDEKEQAEILRRVDQMPWMTDMKRRVQHYGWKYDYKARRVTRDMCIGPLPEWASELARRLAREQLLPWIADQVIVNEYVDRQGISKHIDCVPCFEEAIAMVSLLEPWHMRFVHPSSKEKVEIRLERGSVAVIRDEARYSWMHEIPKRKREPDGFLRTRRVSLTFRKVRIA